MSTKVRRPVLRWHGGKWRLAPWIVAHLPPHRVYVEPYGGAASVLLRKPRSFGEVYNDLAGDAVNVFRVLRDPVKSEELAYLLRLTPYARQEWDLARSGPTQDLGPVERARRTIVRAMQGFASGSVHEPTGFRSNATRSHTPPAMDWAHYPDAVHAFTARLRGVVIEHMDALDLIARYDRTDALIYADPPYVHGTRSGGTDNYEHEMDDDQHAELARVLLATRAMVVLSGYQSALYDDLYACWDRGEIATMAQGAKARTEVLWLNPAASRARSGAGLLDFGGGA